MSEIKTEKRREGLRSSDSPDTRSKKFDEECASAMGDLTLSYVEKQPKGFVALCLLFVSMSFSIKKTGVCGVNLRVFGCILVDLLT